MRKMKDSGIDWIGEIPERWRITNIGKLFLAKAGGDAKADLYSDEKDDYHPYPVYTNAFDENQVYAYTSLPVFPKNSITVTGRGDIGHAIFRKTEFDAIIRLNVLTSKFDLCEKYFVYFIDTVIPFFTNSAAVGQLSATQITSYNICFPPINEQQAIAAHLDRICSEIDSVIEKTKATIEEYKSLKQSVITQAVTKGIRKGRKMKDSRIEWIGEIPEEWNKCRIKHIFTTYSGATPKSEKKEYWDGDIIWITPADFKTEQVYIEKGKRTITFEGYKSCGTTLIPPNSIVFSKRAPIGTVVINTKELCTNQGCLSCVKSDMVSEKYYYYLFSIYTEIFELLGSGTTFKEISFDSFVNFVIVKPSFAEQQEIVDYLDEKCSEIDKLIAKKEQLLTELESYKKSVIYEYVTGKKEVG